MEAFRFSLEKVLEWRRAQLQADENRLKQQAAMLAELDRARTAVEGEAAAEEAGVRRSTTVTGQDLSALEGFRRQAKKRLQALAARRADCRRQLEERQRAVLEARRRARLLERLRERRWDEWRAARDRELEEVAAESYLARWNRERMRAHPERPPERPMELGKK